MRNSGVNVVLTNNSWGGGSYSEGLIDAIAASGESDMLFVAAAGNGGSSTARYPACMTWTTSYRWRPPTMTT